MRFTETVLETYAYGVKGGSLRLKPPPLHCCPSGIASYTINCLTFIVRFKLYKVLFIGVDETDDRSVLRSVLNEALSAFQERPPVLPDEEFDVVEGEPGTNTGAPPGAKSF